VNQPVNKTTQPYRIWIRISRLIWIQMRCLPESSQHLCIFGPKGATNPLLLLKCRGFIVLLALVISQSFMKSSWLLSEKC